MPLLAASSWESLAIFAVIVIISAVSNWLKRRHGQPEDTWPKQAQPHPQGQPAQPPAAPDGPPQPTPRPRPALDWEKELRRLFEGEPEPAPPPPPPRPKPVILAPTAGQRQPPPVAAPRSRPVTRTAPPVAPRSTRPTPLPVPTSSPVRFPAEGDSAASTAPSFELAALEQSRTAYQRASQLDEKTGARMETVVSQTVHPKATRPPVRRARLAPEVALTLTQLRHPRAARQAVVASVILGPPKAFE